MPEVAAATPPPVPLLSTIPASDESLAELFGVPAIGLEWLLV